MPRKKRTTVHAIGQEQELEPGRGQSAFEQFRQPLVVTRFGHVPRAFRPGRGCRGALQHTRLILRPGRAIRTDSLRHNNRVIEGYVKGCLD